MWYSRAKAKLFRVSRFPELSSMASTFKLVDVDFAGVGGVAALALSAARPYDTYQIEALLTAPLGFVDVPHIGDDDVAAAE
jgi:hypothetical protein